MPMAPAASSFGCWTARRRGRNRVSRDGPPVEAMASLSGNSAESLDLAQTRSRACPETLSQFPYVAGRGEHVLGGDVDRRAVEARLQTPPPSARKAPAIVRRRRGGEAERRRANGSSAEEIVSSGTGADCGPAGRCGSCPRLFRGPLRRGSRGRAPRVFPEATAETTVPGPSAISPA